MRAGIQSIIDTTPVHAVIPAVLDTKSLQTGIPAAFIGHIATGSLIQGL